MEVATPKRKSHEIEYPVHPLILERKSIRAFSSQPIEPTKIASLFEATRWAPSSTNEQPWIYLYATPDQKELWQKLFDCLNDGNKVWAQNAPLLIVSLARKNFSRFAGTNAHALYDLGGANSFLALQAVSMGLQIRQMGGFNAQKAIQNLNVPEELEVAVFIAVGYPGDPATLPEPLRQRELSPRERYVQDEFVMNQPF